MKQQNRFVQIKNPYTGMYIKIDCKKGMIYRKKTTGEYKGIKKIRGTGSKVLSHVIADLFREE